MQHMALTKPILQVYETERSLFIASPFSIILFFKTNVTQSVTEFILYSQKTRNYGHFLTNLGEKGVRM